MIQSPEVYVKYADPESGNWNTALTYLMRAIANNTGSTVVDGGRYSGSTVSFPHGGLANTSGSLGDAPKAFYSMNLVQRGALNRFTTTVQGRYDNSNKSDYDVNLQ